MHRLDVPRFHQVDPLDTTDKKLIQSSTQRLQSVADAARCKIEVSYACVNGSPCLIWGSEHARDFTTMYLAVHGDRQTKEGWTFTPGFAENTLPEFREKWCDTLERLVVNEGIPVCVETTVEGDKKFHFRLFSHMATGLCLADEGVVEREMQQKTELTPPSPLPLGTTYVDCTGCSLQ
jgi:hypothetical protein